MTRAVASIAALLSVGCASSEAKDDTALDRHADGIHATGVTVDVPWDDGEMRLRAGEARLSEKSDTLELGGGVRFDWPGRVSGRAGRAAVDFGAASISLEDGVEARFVVDEELQEEGRR